MRLILEVATYAWEKCLFTDQPQAWTHQDDKRVLCFGLPLGKDMQQEVVQPGVELLNPEKILYVTVGRYYPEEGNSGTIVKVYMDRSLLDMCSFPDGMYRNSLRNFVESLRDLINHREEAHFSWTDKVETVYPKSGVHTFPFQGS